MTWTKIMELYASGRWDGGKLAREYLQVLSSRRTVIAPNAWGMWVDVNREYKRKDPIPLGPDTKAASTIFKALQGDPERFKALLRQYLSDRAPFLLAKGHALQYLSPNKYLSATRTTDPGNEFLEYLERSMLEES